MDLLFVRMHKFILQKDCWVNLITILLPIVFTSAVFASPISSVYQQKCGICHGFEGEKIAFGKSEAIHGMPVEKIEQALYDYASNPGRRIAAVV